MINIGGIQFDTKKGVVQRLQRTATPFRNAASDGVGIQVTPEYGPAFSLMVTRNIPEALVATESQAITRMTGTRVAIVERFGGTVLVYASFFLGQQEFAVVKAQVISQESKARSVGFRPTGSYNYAPAVKLTCQFDLHAVKL